MDREVAIFFYNELRLARLKVHDDAEAFGQIIYVIENIGRYNTDRGIGLGGFYATICAIARVSPLAEVIPASDLRHLLTPFPDLYNMVRKARNDAMHEGVFARHLANHAVELAIILEHSLMSNFNYVSDYMVRNPICAELWQPLCVIRQNMLKHSFSYLPVRIEASGDWKLISDYTLARYLRETDSNSDQSERLRQTLQSALQSGNFHLDEAVVHPPEAPANDVLNASKGLPMLVLDAERHLLGILTSFDLL